MGHRNIPFTGHRMEMDDMQGHSHLHPEPSIFYGTTANFPQPHFHPVVPASGNQCNFNFHLLPERHDGSLFYAMPQYSSVQPHYPAANPELAGAAPPSHYNPYLAPPSGFRDFPGQVNHGAHDLRGALSIPTDSYCQNIPHMDRVRESFKRKNAEGMPSSYPYHNYSAGPSSSVAPATVRPAEPDIALTNAASFPPSEYVGINPASIVEGGSLRSVGNRGGMIGPESVMAHNASHLVQGNYVTPHVQLPGNPWLDMHFGANNGDISTFVWTQAPNLPFVHAGVSRTCVETGNMGVQGYQVTASSRSSAALLHPHVAQGHSNPHHPTPSVQGVRGYNANYPSQVAPSSRRISAISSSNASSNPYHDAVDSGTTVPVPPRGFQLYQPHRREILLNSNERNLPNLRVLLEDDVAVLEIPGYHEARDAIDQHRDMRLDIDHMSYEELLALGEQIGCVGTGLSEEFIHNNLKLRTFSSSEARGNLEGTTYPDQQMNFCVVCQTDYEYQANIGSLDCGHEYHRECIKKWLLVKNICPVCKLTALSGKGKDV